MDSELPELSIDWDCGNAELRRARQHAANDGTGDIYLREVGH